MGSLGCSFAALSLIPTRKRTPSSLPRKEPLSQRGVRPVAHVGRSKRMRENAKDSGLGHDEVRSFIGWYRHIRLVLVALAFLRGICATEQCSTSPPAPSAFPTRLTLLPLTVVSRASSACTADLARSFVCVSGAGLVVVASWPAKSCQL
jgi:hypothetical protein